MRLHLTPAFALSAIALAACSTNSAMPPTAAANFPAMQQQTIPVSIPQGVPSERLGDVHFTVALPLRNQAELDSEIAAISDPDSPQYRNFSSHEDFMTRFAPTVAARVAVARELQAAGFRVSIADQAVMAGGTQRQVERYFHTSLNVTRTAADSLAIPRTPIRLSPLLERSGATVIGLDGIPLLRHFSQSAPLPRPLPDRITPDNFLGPYGPYFTVDLKQAYQYPSYTEAAGAGAVIGIVIDSPVSPADIAEYFKYQEMPQPKVETEKINGGGQLGGDGTFEATLDVEQSGGMAPKATIAVFDIPQLSDTDIYDGYTAVVKAKGVTVVNSSFGGCELAFKSASGAKALKAFDSLFEEGLKQGTTWVAASGDHAADMCGSANNALGVSWPAVSPYVLGVGGTNLTTSYTKGSLNSTYVHEDAYADIKPSGANYWGSAGGYSVVYARPKWQNGFVTKKGRGVPDVSVHMGGEGFSSGGTQCQAEKCGKDDSSDAERVGGKWTEAIGTSAASPDFVGLLADTASLAKKPLGFVNQAFYVAAHKKKNYFFRSGIKGDNGYKTDSSLWDPVLGLGTPFGAHIAGAKETAGMPTSSSNP